MNPEKLANSTTTDGKVPRPGFETGKAPAPINPETGLHEAYWVLTEEERAKGFVRPVRQEYVHHCGTHTRMSHVIAETYAAKPGYYGSTFCVGCRGHFPVGEFKWAGTNEVVGS